MRFSTADLSPPHLYRSLYRSLYRILYRILYRGENLYLATADPPLYHCTQLYTRKLCCAHNPFVLNWISLSSIHTTLLFLHRSLPLTDISNLPSPFWIFTPLSCSDYCNEQDRTKESKKKIVQHVDIAWQKYRYVEWRNGGGIACCNRLRLLVVWV